MISLALLKRGVYVLKDGHSRKQKCAVSGNSAANNFVKEEAIFEFTSQFKSTIKRALLSAKFIRQLLNTL